MPAEVERHPVDPEVVAENERLAEEHPIEDYYERSLWPLRLIERRRLALIRRMLGELAGRDLLDVGAGGGHVLELFPRARRTALDVSTRMLDVARRRLAGGGVRFVHGDVTRIEWPDRSFDAIVCTEVLEHVADPGRILAAIARLLRPGGRAVVTAPNDPLILRMKGLARRTPLATLLGARVDWGGDAYHLHRWTPREFRELVARHLSVVAWDASPLRAAPIRVVVLAERRS
jgi:2-polyprenyl-3-methyl-5-hydroxy-6-metoxy-1,4-benzoquinol methylase